MNGVSPAAIVSAGAVADHGQPGQPDRVDEDAADEHHPDRAADVAIPAELGQPAHDGTRHDEPDEVATGRAQDDRRTALALGEERQADQAEQDVQGDGREPATSTERAADDQDAERLAGERARASGRCRSARSGR